MQGFKMVAQELQETLREITMLGYGLILTSHSKEKPTDMKDAEGNTIMGVQPDLSKNVYTVCNAICDLIGYLNVEWDKDGNSKRYLYTRQTPTIFAGSRWRYLEPKIEFGYNELVDAIGTAIEKSAQLNGSTVVEHQVQEVVTKIPFNDVMAQAREIWMTYLDVEDEEAKEHRLLIMREKIRQIFGNDEFKLSQATPGQQDLLEMFCEEMKELL